MDEVVLDVGTAVICQYHGAEGGQDFYEGVISAIHYEDGTVDIQYNDGDQEFHVHPSFVAINTQVSDNQDQTNLTSADIIPWQVGDRVQAVYAAHNGGETLYPGTIAAANADGTFAVAYDDGDIENQVDPQLIVALPPVEDEGSELQPMTGTAPEQLADPNLPPELPSAANSAVPEQTLLSRPAHPGDPVQALFDAVNGGDLWYAGWVLTVNDDGSCNIAYCDGDSERGVHPDHVRVCALHHPFSPPSGAPLEFYYPQSVESLLGQNVSALADIEKGIEFVPAVVTNIGDDYAEVTFLDKPAVPKRVALHHIRCSANAVSAPTDASSATPHEEFGSDDVAEMQSEQFTPAFGVGAVVLARRHLAGVLGRAWYPGRVVKVTHLDSTTETEAGHSSESCRYVIAYDDGRQEEDVHPKWLSLFVPFQPESSEPFVNLNHGRQLRLDLTLQSRPHEPQPHAGSAAAEGVASADDARANQPPLTVSAAATVVEVSEDGNTCDLLFKGVPTNQLPDWRTPPPPSPPTLQTAPAPAVEPAEPTSSCVIQ